MGSPSHLCHLINEMESDETIEDISESVDDLRERLANVKRMMKEQSGYTLGELAAKKKKKSDVLNGDLLSYIFAGVFLVVMGASSWAFYNLYRAVLKKFPSHHTEL